MLAPFLLIAHAALEGRPCPSDDALAEVYGTRSPGRVRRLLAYIEGQGMIVARIAFAGKRSIALPRLGMRSEEHTSELQSLLRRSYAAFFLTTKKASKST